MLLVFSLHLPSWSICRFGYSLAAQLSDRISRTHRRSVTNAPGQKQPAGLPCLGLHRLKLSIASIGNT